MDSTQNLNEGFRLDSALLRFDAIVRRDLLLPAYAGSTLRGAWGHALRARACSTGLSDCRSCPVRTDCAYTPLFETLPVQDTRNGQKLSEAPRPYVLHPPSWGERRWTAGERFSFHQLLIGPAVHEAELVSSAWDLALSNGIGAGGGRADLLSVSQIGDGGMRMLFGQGLGAFHPAEREPFKVQAIPQEFHLELFSPLRLQTQGRPLPLEQLTPKRFLSAVLRRVRLLAQHHGAGDPVLDDDRLFAQFEGIIERKDLQWTDWQRQSSRQGRSMNLGGYTGKWHWRLVAAPDSALSALLSIGQLVHVGKETTFGMGGYRLVG